MKIDSPYSLGECGGTGNNLLTERRIKCENPNKNIKQCGILICEEKDMELNRIYTGDCLKKMKQIKDQSIDMILCDLPYGVSNNKWDSVIPLDQLWIEYKRVTKPNAAIVLTATQPFTSTLVNSNLEMFRYENIWVKTVGSGQLNINHRPLNLHESILVFFDKRSVYNEQKTVGKPYKINRDVQGDGYNKQKAHKKINSGFRHATSVIYCSNPRIKGGHPTQKPVELFKRLVLTYTNTNDVVLDSCIGSGTTAIACLETSRQFIGIEKEVKYSQMAKRRIKSHENSRK